MSFAGPRREGFREEEVPLTGSEAAEAAGGPWAVPGAVEEGEAAEKKLGSGRKSREGG